MPDEANSPADIIDTAPQRADTLHSSDAVYRRKNATREWLEAHPVTVADLRALDAEIEKRACWPRRMWLDYSKLTTQELADLQAMMEKMQVPAEGEADAKDCRGVGPKEG